MRVAILILTFLLFSCNSNSPKTDADNAVPDKDSAVETDIETVDDLSDEALAELEESPDVDTAVECLDLRYNENTLKTGFPFKDKDGKPTFCRPGCNDIPTETDPQCVRNIWEWDNWEKYQKYLEAEKKDPEQKEERECYPWPCVLPEMKASTGGSLKSKCDRRISVNGYTSTMGAVWTHGMSDGVAGMYMSNGAIEYDPETDQFVKIGQAMGRLSYNKKRYVVLAFESMPSDNPAYKSFVVSVLRKDGKYYYELVYDNKEHNSFMGNPSFAGDEWVLIQICEGSSGSCDVKYAKAGEWEWHSLGLGKVFEGNIVGDRLTFMVPYTDPDRQIYYCDLSKYPKSYKECHKATGTLKSGVPELGHSPRIDEDNKNRLIYYLYGGDNGVLKLIETDFTDTDNPSRKEIVIDTYMQPSKVQGNLIMSTANNGYGLMSCWYRFDKQKKYCPVSNEMMEFGTFDGKWHLWRDSIDVRIRDWDCYCTETGICPFEE